MPYRDDFEQYMQAPVPRSTPEEGEYRRINRRDAPQLFYEQVNPHPDQTRSTGPGLAPMPGQRPITLAYAPGPQAIPESASAKIRSAGGFRGARGYAAPVDDRGYPMPVIDLRGHSDVPRRSAGASQSEDSPPEQRAPVKLADPDMELFRQWAEADPEAESGIEQRYSPPDMGANMEQMTPLQREQYRNEMNAWIDSLQSPGAPAMPARAAPRQKPQAAPQATPPPKPQPLATQGQGAWSRLWEAPGQNESIEGQNMSIAPQRAADSPDSSYYEDPEAGVSWSPDAVGGFDELVSDYDPEQNASVAPAQPAPGSTSERIMPDKQTRDNARQNAVAREMLNLMSNGVPIEDAQRRAEESINSILTMRQQAGGLPAVDEFLDKFGGV